MAMAEVGYALSTTFTGHFVASEELVPGAGQNYRTAYAALKTNPAAVTSTALSAGMVTSYQTQYGGSGLGWDTFSAVATAGYGQLISALAQFVTATDAMSPTDRTTLRNLITSGPSICFADDSFCDLGKFMTRVVGATSLPQAARTAATAVGSAIISMVTAKTADARSSSGIAVYLPRAADSYLASYSSTAAAFCTATGWDRFARWLATGNRSMTGAAAAGNQRAATSSGSRGFSELPAAAFAHLSWSAYGAEASQSSDGRNRGRGFSRLR
jgi:hypothetical protein